MCFACVSFLCRSKPTFLVYRDPFMLPRQMHLKKAVSEIRKEFSADTLSDHMALLKVFQVIYLILKLLFW